MTSSTRSGRPVAPANRAPPFAWMRQHPPSIVGEMSSLDYPRLGARDGPRIRTGDEVVVPLWYRTHRPICPMRPEPGTQGRMGRVRTHMAVVSSGWGPSGRRFKSGLPDSKRLPETAYGNCIPQPRTGEICKTPRTVPACSWLRAWGGVVCPSKGRTVHAGLSAGVAMVAIALMLPAGAGRQAICEWCRVPPYRGRWSSSGETTLGRRTHA